MDRAGQQSLIEIDGVADQDTCVAIELSDTQLALVGGGIADVVLS